MIPLGSARTGLNPYLRLMVTAWVSSCLFANLDIFLLTVGDLVNFLRLTLLRPSNTAAPTPWRYAYSTSLESLKPNNLSLVSRITR